MTMGEVLEQQAEVVLHLRAPYANKVDNTLSTENQFKVTYNIAAIKRFQVEDRFRQVITPSV